MWTRTLYRKTCLKGHTFPKKKANSAPEHNALKDRLILLLGGNISGEFKFKLLLLYCFLNSKALCGIIKASHPVIWKADVKAWVTIASLENWYHFSLLLYIIAWPRKFRILPVLDNMTCKGHILPPSITLQLQAMDQGVIASFMVYYLRQKFSHAVRAPQDNLINLRRFGKNYNIYDAIII